MRRTVAIAMLYASAFFILVECGVSLYLTGKENYPNGTPPARSIEESKAKRIFVEEVEMLPTAFQWNGQKVAIQEAWLEHASELQFRIVVIPSVIEHRHTRILEGYNLCFTVTPHSVQFYNTATSKPIEGSGGTYCFPFKELRQLPFRFVASENRFGSIDQFLDVKRKSR